MVCVRIIEQCNVLYRSIGQVYVVYIFLLVHDLGKPFFVTD